MRYECVSVRVWECVSVRVSVVGGGRSEGSECTVSVEEEQSDESSTQASLARTIDKACYWHFQASPQAKVFSTWGA